MKRIATLLFSIVFTLNFYGQPINNAEPIGAGGGGSFSKIIINPTSGEYWAANDMGGVFKSTDKGVTWQYLSENFHGFSIYDIEFDPTNPSTVYALHNNGVEKTTDGGLTWTMITATQPENATATMPHIGNSFHLGETFKRLELLKIDPQNSSIIYTAGHYITPYTVNVNPHNFYIYKSTDGGASWNNIPSGLSYPPPDSSFFVGSIHTLEINEVNTNTIYAAGYYGFYKSFDGGTSWANFSNGLPYEALPKARSLTELVNGDPADKYKGAMLIDLVKHPTDTNTLFATTASHGVYKTIDGGLNWNPLNGTGANVLDLMPYDSLFPYDDYQHGIMNKVLVMDPTNPNRLVFATVTGFTKNILYETTDGGVNWHPLLEQYPSIPAATIGVNSPFYTLQDSAFASCHMNDCGGPTYSLAIDPFAPDTIIGSGSINLERLVVAPTGDSLLSRELFYKDLYVITPFSLGPSITSLNGGQSIYIAGMDISIHKTTNGGTTWQSMMTSNIVNYNGNRAWIHARSIRAVPTSPPTLFIGAFQSVLEGSVYKSADDGNSWTRLTSGLPMPPATGQGACLQVEPSFDYINDNTVYAVYDHAGVFKSTNGGSSFTAINSGLPNSSVLSFQDKPQPFAIHPDSADVLFLTTTLPTKTLYKSTNGGASWNTVSALNDSIGYVMGGTTVTTDSLGNTIILVSGEYGIIRSADNGNTWNVVSGVYDLVPVAQLAENWVQELPFTKVVVNPTNRQNLFFTIATYGTTERLPFHGIYASDDAGLTWYKMFNTPYLGGNIVVADDGSSILSFSGGMDVWRHALPSFNSITENPLSSISFTVFPNPTESELNVNFEKLPKNKYLLLSDLHGRLISRVLAQQNNVISLSNLASGIYILSIEEEGKMIARKKVIKK